MIYDNHYSMSSQLGYVTNAADENGNMVPSLKAFEQYMTPVYSSRNSTTKVTYELTDYVIRSRITLPIKTPSFSAYTTMLLTMRPTRSLFPTISPISISRDLKKVLLSAPTKSIPLIP